MNKQEFDEKYVGENIVVHCKTEELANELLKLANSFGYTKRDWENNMYYIFESETCYRISSGMYSPKEFYEENKEEYEKIIKLLLDLIEVGNEK